MTNPNKYALTALKAAALLQAGLGDPVQAWEQAAWSVFHHNPASRVKGCPKGAFLGLCEAGLVKGVRPGAYTQSVKNKAYAVRAVKLLRDRPTLADSPDSLWAVVLNGQIKAHNSQMDVVTALWHKGLILLS